MANEEISRLNGRNKTNGRFLKGRTPWNKGLKGYKPKGVKHFEKGHLPHTAKPVGSEKIDKDGFVRVKISNDGAKYKVWKLKHHLVYKQYHPEIEIGENDRVIFLDGNKRNFDISNLELISRREQMVLSRLADFKNADETRTLISLIRLRHKLLDLGADRYYNYQKKYYVKNKEKFKESGRKSAKKRREKKKHI